MNRDILRFITRLLFYSLPILVLTAVYLLIDPFKVTGHYDNFYPGTTNGGVALNQGYVSCAVYQNFVQKYHYDSFIFGNSRSLYYPVAKWEQYLDSCSTPLHMSASSETLLGLTRKIEWIDKSGGVLRNVLITADNNLLSNVEASKTDRLAMLPPQLAGTIDALRFQFQSFHVFMMPQFFFAVIDYTISGKLKPYMIHDRQKLMDEDMFTYDAVHNEMNFSLMEKKIADGVFYDQKRIDMFMDFPQSPDSISPVAIGERQMELLQSINSIVKKHHTNIVWVINPLYDQIRINPADVATLKKLFGENNVFDFSGPNKWNADYHNYYETAHYRPIVACEVLDSIYRHHSRKP